LSSLAKVVQQASALNLIGLGYQKSQRSNLHSFLLEQLLRVKTYARNLYKVPSQVHISVAMLLFQMSPKVGRLKVLLREARQSPMIRSSKSGNFCGTKI
jgi:hypothetical protein